MNMKNTSPKTNVPKNKSLSKIIFVLVATLFFASASNSQNYIEKNGKYALVDSEGNNLTEFLYDEISLSFVPFHEAKRNGETYLLDDKGQELLLATNLESINENTEAIILTEGNFKEFPLKILEARKLKLLMFRLNELNMLPDEFVKLTELYYLDLNSNQLTRLPDDFGKLNKLTYLALNGNQLIDLPESFKNLHSLKELRLSFNKFKEVPMLLAELLMLEELHLDYNEELSFSSLCKVFSNYPRKIYISGNVEGIASPDIDLYISIPDKILDISEALEIKNLYEIERGCGDCPYITNIPKIMIDYLRNKRPFNNEEVAHWEKNNPEAYKWFLNIENLTFSGLGMESLPDGLPQFQKLKHFFAEDNQLKQLPTNFGDIKTIESLVLSGNNINEFPKEILKLKNLKRLYLDNNPIDELPDEIVLLENLNEISLKGCPIYSVNDSVLGFLKGKLNSYGDFGDPEQNYANRKLKKLPKGFCRNTDITELNLQGNLLNDLPDGISSFKDLVYLNLDSNGFEVFPKAILQCRELSQLILNNNQLKEIPENISQLDYLNELELKNNKLTSLPKSIKKMHALVSLKLQGNNFSEKEKSKIRKWLPDCEIEF